MREGERHVRSPADSSRPVTGCQNGLIPAILDRDSQATLPGEVRVELRKIRSAHLRGGKKGEVTSRVSDRAAEGVIFAVDRSKMPRRRTYGKHNPFPEAISREAASPSWLGATPIVWRNNPRLEPSLACLSQIVHTRRYEAHRPCTPVPDVEQETSLPANVEHFNEVLWGGHGSLHSSMDGVRCPPLGSCSMPRDAITGLGSGLRACSNGSSSTWATSCSTRTR
jgi:hypothetical protein